MEATINLNMTIDFGKWDISKTFRERVKETQDVIPLLDCRKFPLLLENYDGDTLPIRDKLINIYIDKALHEPLLKNLFSVNQSHTAEDVGKVLNLLTKKLSSCMSMIRIMLTNSSKVLSFAYC